MSILYVKTSDKTPKLRIRLYLFAEHLDDGRDGFSRFRCKPEHMKAFDEYERRKQVFWL